MSLFDEILRAAIVIRQNLANRHSKQGLFLKNLNLIDRIYPFQYIIRQNLSIFCDIECSPGMFKTIPNRAGMTEFVDPSLVEGTLKYGFRYYKVLKEPLARAIFMMFMCSEVHPFTDGNGRVSRIMMNAELAAAKQTRIIVPTAYRDDYILALRKLSRQGKPDTFIEVMQRLQHFSQNLFGEDFDTLNLYLISCNAYEKPEVARLKFIDRLGSND